MDEKKADDEKRGFWVDSAAIKWLAKSVGREVEIYTTRAPKVAGKLVAVDERFGRLVVQSNEEEVIMWASGLTQIRMPKDNGHKREGATK